MLLALFPVHHTQPPPRVPPIAAEQRIADHDYSCIAHGQVFVGTSWLSEDLLQSLRSDMRNLLGTGSFFDAEEPIGNRLKLELNPPDWSAPGEKEPSAARAAVRRQFDALRVELERVVGRTLFLDALGAQAKYTIGKLGEPIHWHIDQRHEAFATRHYGQEPTRRSLAWLLYLSDDGWNEPGGSGNGGELRAYPRADVAGRVGAHEGNLQVGWLDRGCGSEPVFLDCWVAPDWMAGGSLADLRRDWAEQYEAEAELDATLQGLVQPAYVLYCVDSDGQRDCVSDVWESPLRDDSTGEYLQHVPSLREMLPEELRAGFSSTTAQHPQQRCVEVAPRGATLVIFDSVAVPHEVLPTIEGERLLLFGFFAEKRTIPPTWRQGEGEGAWFHDGWAHTEEEVDST